VAAAWAAAATALHSQLATVDEEAAKRAVAAGDVEAAEARVAELEAALPPEPPDQPADATTAAALKAELATRRAAVERAHRERARIEERLVGQRARRAAMDSEGGRHRETAAVAQAAEPGLVAAAEEAGRRLDQADAQRTAAEEALRAATTAEQQWRTRAEALKLALDDARARTGAERLAGLDGVVG